MWGNAWSATSTRSGFPLGRQRGIFDAIGDTPVRVRMVRSLRPKSPDPLRALGPLHSLLTRLRTA